MSVSASIPVHSVQATPCLRRVLAIARRAWDPIEAADLAQQMTMLLKTPSGTMTLRPVQAVSLAEAGTTQGLFAPIRVGGGKTLISLLLAYVVNARRPFLALPAKLIEKTKRELLVLRQHWRIPTSIRIESYEKLGRADHAELLDRYQPDLIVLDECHRVKNPRAAVTKRIMRYLSKGACRFVAMGGTITRRSLHDYAHLVRRCIGPDNAPVPRSYHETEEWADALDEVKGENTVGTGALRLLCNDTELVEHGTDPIAACRRAFRRRLVETPGVVATEERFQGASLSINAVRPTMGPAVHAAFRRLREAWVLPDSSPLADGLAVWRHARELALGFYYVWDPAPPKTWLEPRREWCSTCRRILTTNRRDLDSELQVARAVADGFYPDATAAWSAWREVRDGYKPRTVPVWTDDGAVAWAARWAKRGPGIIWVEHQAFGEKLAAITGLPYFGAQGVDAGGRPIESADHRTCVIASIASNSEGRNLQAWSRNLITSPPASGAAWEQLLGRTHRDGQEADEVAVEYFVTCDEHASGFEQARRDAEYIETITGQAQKLRYADIDTGAKQ